MLTRNLFAVANLLVTGRYFVCAVSTSVTTKTENMFVSANLPGQYFALKTRVMPLSDGRKSLTIDSYI